MILRVVEEAERDSFLVGVCLSALPSGSMVVRYSMQDRASGGRGDGQPSNRAKASGRGLSPDAAKTDHVRVIIGIRAACKEGGRARRVLTPPKLRSKDQCSGAVNTPCMS